MLSQWMRIMQIHSYLLYILPPIKCQYFRPPPTIFYKARKIIINYRFVPDRNGHKFKMTNRVLQHPIGLESR